MSLGSSYHPRNRGVGVVLSLHPHGRKKDVLPHDGGDIRFFARGFRLVLQLAQDKEEGDREQ